VPPSLLNEHVKKSSFKKRRQLFEKGFEFKIYCLKKWFLKIKKKNTKWIFKKKKTKKKKKNKLHNGTRLRRREFSQEQ